MVKLQKMKSGSYALTVPKTKVKKLKLKAGDEFDVTYAEGNLIFIKLKEK